jgi:hypothetical protein
LGLVFSSAKVYRETLRAKRKESSLAETLLLRHSLLFVHPENSLLRLENQESAKRCGEYYFFDSGGTAPAAREDTGFEVLKLERVFALPHASQPWPTKPGFPAPHRQIDNCMIESPMTTVRIKPANSYGPEPRAGNLLEMIAMPAERYPDVVAIGLCHHGREPEAITWRELCTSAWRRSYPIT